MGSSSPETWSLSLSAFPSLFFNLLKMREEEPGFSWDFSSFGFQFNTVDEVEVGKEKALAFLPRM